MSDTKISLLPAGANSDSTELVAVVQGGVTKALTVAQIARGVGLVGSGVTAHDSAASAPAHSVQDHDQRVRRLATDAPWNADPTGAAEAGVPIQAHIDFMNALGFASALVLESNLPSGSFRLDEGLSTRTAGSGQSGFVGAGTVATVLKPTADFTALTIATSVHDSGGFRIVWTSGIASSTRVGVHFADAVNQVDQCQVYDIRVDNAYRSFVMDPSSQTVYLFKQRNLHSVNAVDWHFHYDAANGSTTFSTELLYAQGSLTVTPSAKGIFINNFTDVFMQSDAVDQCTDQWLVVLNANTFNAQNLAFESCRVITADAAGTTLTVDRAVINGYKDVTNTYDVGATPGKANGIRLGATTKSLTISGYSQQFATIGANTTFYKITLNSPTSHVYVLDDSVQLSEIDTNGYYANVTIRGRRMSTLNQAPNYGTWGAGEVVWFAGATAGGAQGSECLIAGSPGVWSDFGAIRGANLYAVTNPTTDRALNVTGDTLPQVAAVLGTLIADLKLTGILL